MGTSPLQSHSKTLQHRRVDTLVRCLFLTSAPPCRCGSNSPSILEGVPVGRGSNMSIKFLVIGIGLTANAGVPTLAFGHPFQRKGNLASAAAARSGQGNTSNVLPPMSQNMHLSISQSLRNLNNEYEIEKKHLRTNRRCLSCGAYENRTHDLLTASQTL